MELSDDAKKCLRDFQKGLDFEIVKENGEDHYLLVDESNIVTYPPHYAIEELLKNGLIKKKSDKLVLTDPEKDYFKNM